jgi:hypothetical protein
MLYKKNLLAFRGSFRPITSVGYDMLQTSYALFRKDEDHSEESTLSICEITLKNLMHEGSMDERDFLDRVNLLNGMGLNVMISNFREYYKLVSYFSAFRLKKLRIVIGIPTLINVWDESYYKNLKGGILEAFGMLFTKNMKLYVYPSLDPATGKLITSSEIPLKKPLKSLYEYLLNTKSIVDVECGSNKLLHINSSKVLDLIESGDKEWEKMVPDYAREYIKKNKVFGYGERSA